MASEKSHLDGLIDSEVISNLSHLPLFSKRPMQGSVSGRHQSPFRGSSIEFAEYRKYVPGDDTRRLDWRAFGRSDRFYLKEFEADTNLRCYIVIDASGSMGFGSDRKLSKYKFASKLAATMAYIAIGQGDAAGLTILRKGKVIEVPPKRKPAHLRLLAEKLAETKPSGEPPFSKALHELAEKVPQRAFFLLLSDLYFDPESLREAMDHLRFAKHDVSLFQVSDPNEVNFSFDRPMRFVDMEEGPDMLTDPQVIKNDYLNAFESHQREVKKILSETMVDYQHITTDQNLSEILSRFLAARAPKKV